MPVYEYECLVCGVGFEALVLKASEKEGVKCPKCNSRNLEEKISRFASCAGPGDCAPASGG